VITRRNTKLVMMPLGSVARASHGRALKGPRLKRRDKADLILVGVTQTLGTLSRNCEGLAAAQCRNRLKPEQFRTIRSDLFGNVTLVRNQGRTDTSGQGLVEVFATAAEAGQALEVLAAAKRRRGYRDL
jgi:predicted DNA-binding WGR domain protein